jgi:ACR3 family arsenite transporter
VMTRAKIETKQVWIYLAAILAGLVFGSVSPEIASRLENVIWPILALLLLATFTQVPLARLFESFRDGKFMSAAILGNFLLLPMLVLVLLHFAPNDPAIRLGIALVLLVPCTDWFITFAHQGGGDAARAIAITPAMLLIQIVMLPVYAALFMGTDLAQQILSSQISIAFLTVILTPLGLAYAAERWAMRDHRRQQLIQRLGWLPVPLLALVLFLVAASQVEAVMQARHLASDLLVIFTLFLLGACMCGVLLARLFRLPQAEGRTLLFSFATRNSFVVLPLALALPATWQAAAVVIVYQSMVELFSMLLLLFLFSKQKTA